MIVGQRDSKNATNQIMLYLIQLYPVPFSVECRGEERGLFVESVGVTQGTDN
jgi:hypothetical protein